MKTICTALTTLGSCAAARWYLDRSSRRETSYLGGRVRLGALWNQGAAFGLPVPPKALPLASAAALEVLWTQRGRSPVGAGLILGGGLSNLQERVRQGKVYDYVQFPQAPGGVKHYVFNLADFAILTGGILMVFSEKKGRKPRRK